MELAILDIQPSQLYLSEEKLHQVREWLNPQAGLSPLPVKKIGDRIFFTDGHTRAFLAYEAGLETVPVIWDRDDLNWDFYLSCVAAAEADGIWTIADLGKRILTAEDYQTKWLDWCQDLAESDVNRPKNP